MSNYTLIIPTLNEQNTIADVISLCDKNADLIVVDGGSKDSTAAIAKANGAKVIIINQSGNGIAFRTGVLASNTKYVACLDGDCTYDPSSVTNLVNLMERENLDAIFGDRLHKKDNYMRFHRKVGNMLMTAYLNLLFSTDIKDSQSGYMIFKRINLLGLLPTNNGMAHVQELKISFSTNNNLKIKWVQIAYNDREYGSKFNFFLDGAKLLWHGLITKILSIKLHLNTKI